MPKINESKKAKDLKKSFKQFYASLKPYRFSIYGGILLSLISAILSVTGPKILGEMTTSATNSLMNSGEIDWTPITRLADLLIIIYAVSAILSYFQSIIMGIMTAKYTKDLRKQLLEKITKLPVSYFDKHQNGDTLSRMSNDVDVLAGSLSEEIIEIITSITTIIGILIMMLTISAPLSAIALITVPISIFIIGKITKNTQKIFVNSRDTLGKLNNSIEEDYSGQIVIKSNSHETNSIKKFNEINEKFYKESWKSNFYSRLSFPIVHIITNLGYVMVCIAGGYLTLSGKISIGDIQAFIQYTNQFNRPLGNLSDIVSTIQLTLAASERVFEFLNEKEETENIEKPQTLSIIKGAVEFNNINFGYTPEKQIIKNFSVKIKPSQKVAIVGPTGAGKTTIINLLMRFYEPDSGYITIDGVPIKNMKREDVRKLFGMVLQDTWLFSGTISDNLRYGKETATDEEIETATKATDIDHFIKALPNGYNTEISEDSDNVSAGEKQLLTIARALIANPPMIILDEATSNVDTRTEILIQEAFEKLTKNRTSFVIAHRLSTIRNSDLILVMKDGNIVEQGNHDELLRKNGYYAELYNSQFSEN